MGLLDNSDAILLLGADGAIASSVIRAHNDSFTVNFLRHTILGEKLADVPMAAPLLLRESHAGLLVTPTDEELAAYANRPAKKTASKPAPEASIAVEDRALTQQRFLRHFNKAQIGHSLKAMIELQRSAVTLQMEAVLDAAQANDEKAFITAQGALEVTIIVGMNELGRELKKLGMVASERHEYLQEMTQSAVISAMRNRVNATPEKQDQEALCEQYESLLGAYRKKQQEEAVAKQEGALHKKPPKPKGIVDATSITLRGRQLHPPRHKTPPSGANDYGRGV